MPNTGPAPERRFPTPSDDPRWPENPAAPPGAPNVLVIMTDDVGYGAASTFGGPVPTPTLDGLAETGLRYTRFHTTAMCSPTRAALMTGRNHHRVANGRVTEMALAYDGYTAMIPDSAATVARILRDGGYATAHFGKYHNVPDFETGPAGPFDRWPTSIGFDRFYGFLGGSTHNYAPALYDGTTPVEAPRDDADYHLERDLADRAIDWLRTQKSAAPDKPVFIQYANAACHAPHHAPPEWIEKFRGRFDGGWDALREVTLARQKRLGVVPADTRLTERPDEIAAWDALSSDHKRVAARMMEIYAAALAHADHHIGRVLAELERLGELDNTVVFYLQGDNGSSPEGGPTGSLNEMAFVNRVEERVEDLLGHLDELGGPLHYNHFPNGWAHAMDTPFQWFKVVASHFGGTRNGLVVSYPQRITDAGGVRDQFHHVVDIAPTILDLAGMSVPESVDGVAQLPMDGVSMAYSFGDPAAASTRRTQYFELMGNAAIYHDGWVAATTPTEMPWSYKTSAPAFDRARWELYNVDEDYSQCEDLARAHPERLAELIDVFWRETEANGALPIIAGKANRPGPPKPNPTLGRTRFDFHGVTTRVSPGASPDVTNRSFTLTARIVSPGASGDGEPAAAAEGVLFSQGGRFGGHALYITGGRLVYHYNLLNRERTTIASEAAVTAGSHAVGARFTADEPGRRGTGGPLRLYCDGAEIGCGRIGRTAGWRMNYLEGVNVGADTGTPVDEAYAPPFPFGGRIEEIVLQLE